MRLLQTIHSLDLSTFDWCLKRKHRQLLVSMSRWISRSADGYLYLLISLGFLLIQHWQLLEVLALGFVIERTFYFLLKKQLRRNRPQQTIPGFISVIEPSDQFSFPSGHTSAAFLVMGVISVFYPLVAIPLLIWAIWVGISRVMLGVHFPTDSVAGAAMGYCISQLSLSMLM